MAVPSKLYGVLAAGKPVVVVGPADCEAARLVVEERCGIVLPPGDGATLADSLEGLRRDPDACRKMGERSRQIFERDYELNQVTTSWIEMLNEVSGQDARVAIPVAARSE